MKRMQIQLAPVTYEAVRRRAYDRHVSLALVVREAVERYVVQGSPKAAMASPDGFGFVGVGRTGRTARRPVSVHHDQAIADVLARQHGHGRR